MKRVLLGGVTLALTVSSMTAHAEDAFTLNKPQVGATVGYGIYTGEGDLNPYGVGLGVNGGYTLDMGFHIGGRFEYFLGESQGPASFGVWNFMAEPGYDLGLGPNMVLRPQLGIGMANVRAEVCLSFLGGPQTCASNSESRFTVAPGAMFLYGFDGPFLAAGLRYQHIFEDVNVGGLHITVGGGMAF